MRRHASNQNIDVGCNGSYLNVVRLYWSWLLTRSSMSLTFYVRHHHPYLDWSHFIGNMELNALQILYNKNGRGKILLQINGSATRNGTRFIKFHSVVHRHGCGNGVSTLSIIEDYLFICGKYTLCANAFTQFATVPTNVMAKVVQCCASFVSCGVLTSS